MQIYITCSKQGIDSDLKGPAKKSRGPKNLTRGPEIFIVPPPFDVYLPLDTTTSFLQF